MNDSVKIAVAGNPNSGKTTLFNGLTGSKQRIGNWPGVTVEKKEGVVSIGGRSIVLVDLPGVYSLAAHSEDEKVARDYIISGEPEMVINIIDGTNLERNLYLTMQLLEMKVPLVLIVNMMDLAEKNTLTLDLEILEKMIGCPVVGINATDKKDIEKVKEFISAAMKKQKIPEAGLIYPPEVEKVIEEMIPNLEKMAEDIKINPRWLSIKILEQDTYITDKVISSTIFTAIEIEEKTGFLEAQLGDPPDVILADARFKFIQRLAEKMLKRSKTKESISDKLDKVAMNRYLGIPIFLLVMYGIFWFTMTIGGAFIDFFEIFFGAIFVDGFALLLESFGSPEWLLSVLAGGLGTGIQTVATFVPIIFSMFLMLSLLEDSGYMARAAFVMDRFLRWIGLPGKSFVPMLVGFGCTVPAIMATRTLENKKDRYLTVFMTPFMSCGAKLPVYALFGAAFFGAGAGNMVFSLYLVGIALAILTGLLLKNTLFRGEAAHFIMELPPYHTPKMKNILSFTWHRLKLFIIRAGKVIVIVVLVLAFLNSFGLDGSFGNEDTPNSMLSSIGKGITPVFEPMGVDKENWPASVAIFTGIFAKEVVVGTLNSLYSQIDTASGDDPATEDEFDFIEEIGEAFLSVPENLAGVIDGFLDPLGIAIIDTESEDYADEVGADEEVFSAMQRFSPQGPLQAYAYLLFILIYFPCVAALAAVIRELGRGYGLLLVAYLTVLGWVVATLFYQITLGKEIIWIIIPLLIIICIIFIFHRLGKSSQIHSLSEK